MSLYKTFAYVVDTYCITMLVLLKQSAEPVESYVIQVLYGTVYPCLLMTAGSSLDRRNMHLELLYVLLYYSTNYVHIEDVV